MSKTAVIHFAEALGDCNETQHFESNDDDSRTSLKNKSHVRTLATSESDSNEGFDTIKPISEESIDDDDYTLLIRKKKVHSRIQPMKSDDSDSDDNHTRSQELKKNDNNNQNIERKKKVKIKNKFTKSRENKYDTVSNQSDVKELEKMTENRRDSINSEDDEMISIKTNKKKITERSTSLKMTICDPDTSDEDNSTQSVHSYRQTKQDKHIKLTSPKPKKISSKQAVENMQKIKSESNRMLREKEVSLPYHRPKALNLKDIINRRKPAMSCDGKALPIKMNAEQLKQYASLLEQRQKEMMELCKSDTDDDETENNVLSSTSNFLSTIAKVDNVVTEKILQSDAKNCDDKHLNSVKEQNATNFSTCDKLNNDGKNVNDYLPTSMALKDSTSLLLENSTSEIQDNKISDCNRNGFETQIKAEELNIYNGSIYKSDSNDAMDKVFADIKHGTEKMVVDGSNDSTVVDNNNIVNIEECLEINNVNVTLCTMENATKPLEKESQSILLPPDSEKTNLSQIDMEEAGDQISKMKPPSLEQQKELFAVEQCNDFPDDDADLDSLNLDDIDNLIEKAKIMTDQNEIQNIDSLILIDDVTLNRKPKLTGTPGMIIDLHESDPVVPKKLSGVELLKERFTFFAKLKTPEEMNREKEKRLKPGTQHIKLRQELEEKIAEQKSIEWAKRLENEKQQSEQMGDLNVDDEIDKIEKKIQDIDDLDNVVDTEDEDDENLVENDVLIEDKPRKFNPLIADQAEETDVDESDHQVDEIDSVLDNSDNEIGEGSSSEDESSLSEQEDQTNIPRKRRILKAFEDSDDDDNLNKETTNINTKYQNIFCSSSENNEAPSVNNENEEQVNTQDMIDASATNKTKSNSIDESQDDILQLAQIPKKISEDVFTSQESEVFKQPDDIESNKCAGFINLNSQTFAILNDNNVLKSHVNSDIDCLVNSAKFDVISDTQAFNDNLDDVVGMCSGSFSQNYIEISPPKMLTEDSQSQKFSEDLLNMCTGKFYDNQFISQTKEHKANGTKSFNVIKDCNPDYAKDYENEKVCDILKAEINTVDEMLHETDCKTSRPLKYFIDGKISHKENKKDIPNTQLKKKCVIDSDEEEIKDTVVTEGMKIKTLKRRKLKKRALQISDDEDENSQHEDDLFSDDDNKINVEGRLVEYDSEENEIEVKPQRAKKKRKATEFFEQEAELTSEDEWVGSGDEDEAGLDRMEREAGDDDTFNQNKLQRELGQIHMRDVLDQDKREVRIIQELLFEDGDLGGGGRQRKFRWRNADGDEDIGTLPDEFADTQDDEFESEEQWRKQRHERDMFLRQMKNEDEVNVTLDRTAIIKANLSSKTMSSLLEEANNSKTQEVISLPVPEKKTAKDIPSPAKPYAIFQKNYHGSLLSRGRGALERLAALATPLANEDNPAAVLPPSTKRGFVFAALTPDTDGTKVTKRKAETVNGTPQLVKKMRTEDKKPKSRSSLLDHFKS